MRTIILFLLLLSSVAVLAQKYPDDTRKAKSIFKNAMNFFKRMPEQATQSDTNYVLAKFRELNDALYRIENLTGS